tara:strand:+ start:2247 stop:3179 length:933 start_codon:yes stop_codon:yes gene_type:complete
MRTLWSLQGSIAHRSGVLYVGRHARTARIASFDLDGRRLESGFTFRDTDMGRSSVDGLAADDDHRLWVADGAACRVRAFSLFGREVVTLGDPLSLDSDRRGQLGRPVALAVEGTDDDLVLAVVSGGRRRHAVQLMHPATGRTLSLRPDGDPEGLFQSAVRVRLDDGSVAVLESGRRRIQVFEDGNFHYALDLPGAREEVPTSFERMPDGRIVVALDCAPGAPGGLHLLDRAGRPQGRLDLEEPLVHPADLALIPGDDDASTRVCVIDRDGERVLQFNLEGRAYGSFPTLDATGIHEPVADLSPDLLGSEG